MSNLAHEMGRGARAEALLNDEIIKDAFDTVEKAIVDKWRDSPVGDREGQHELRLMLKAFLDVKKNIEEHVRTGKLATAQFNEENRLKRFKNLFRAA